jgi:uncharacterized protein (DUF427 family)
MPKRESLYAKVPDYRVELKPNPKRVLIRLDGEVLVDSARSFEVCETKLPPILYFPREDVRMEHLERTDHETFCPFKGEASYWTLRVGEHSEANAAWSYEDPFDEVAGLKNYLAFYSDRVECESRES